MADVLFVAGLAALASGTVRVVDLSQPLSAATPVIGLPPPFAQSAPFSIDGGFRVRCGRSRLVLEQHHPG